MAQLTLLMTDTRVIKLAQILCYLREKGGKAPLKRAAEECMVEYATACEYLNKLGNQIVISEQGRHGGTYLLNPDVSLGELSKVFMIEKNVPHTLGNERLRAALNRFNRITINDLTEEDR